MCIDPLVAQIATLALLTLGAFVSGSSLRYGICVEMIGKSDYGWRNWQAAAILSVLTFASTAVAVDVGVGIVRMLGEVQAA